MKQRLVIPEILDSLPAGDSRALRSRRDLSRINALMGNYRWIATRILASSGAASLAWIEVGSGDGPLSAFFPGEKSKTIHITGLDLAPRPENWPASWDWREGDLFETIEEAPDGKQPIGLVANLFLHHFSSDQLATLGDLLKLRCHRILCVEPSRYRLFRILGCSLFPFVNAVTRHDLQVSIGAGFRRGELGTALCLDDSWTIREAVTPLGAYRFEAWKE